MKFSNTNRFEKVRKLEGLKEPEDIWDITTFDNIKQEIEQISPNIKELVSEKELSIEMEGHLNKVRTFCNELSGDFKETFLYHLAQYRSERRQISQNIVDYLLEKNLVLPRLIIADKKQAEVLLEDYNLDEKIAGESFLLVFQLPKPLAQFWWKGGIESWGDLGEDTGNTVIEWGHFYRELMPAVWETQGRHENESGLNFYRLNGLGEHDPNKFYYIWETTVWED